LPFTPDADSIDLPSAQAINIMVLQYVLRPGPHLVHAAFVVKKHYCRAFFQQGIGKVLLGLV
jgi:hypothetical protein